MRKLKIIVNWVLWIVAIVVLTVIINKYVIQLITVSGKSMQPNFNNGQLLIVNKLFKNNIERGDVIIFKTNDKYNKYLIKRVIGLPCEKVKIINNEIYINGDKINDPYRKEKKFKSGIAKKEITLKSDEYFVLGDNRNNSYDSRYETLGPINKKDIMGEFFISLKPFSTKFK